MLLLRVTATRGHALLTKGMRVSEPATVVAVLVSWSTASAHVNLRHTRILSRFNQDNTKGGPTTGQVDLRGGGGWVDGGVKTNDGTALNEVA